MRPAAKHTLTALGILAVAATAVGQFQGFRTRGPSVGPDGHPLDRGSVPTWPVDERFALDTFTFARLRYTSSRREQSSFAWWTDYADADLNLSFRVQQVTSIRVHPEPVVVEITDPKLFNYPWVFMSGAGNITLTDFEAERLRTYLQSGGFLMVDDFWGQAEWDGVARALKKVLPGQEPVDLPRTHQLFHGVYNLPNDLSLQTCNIRSAIANKDTGITWEDNHAGGNTREIHFRAIFDQRNRMMVLLCHNTDNGDGWEEESSDPWFFHTFSEQRNFPLAINILYYAMTH